MVKYKEYTNKSSLDKHNSRLVQGGKTTQTGNKLSWWERYTLAEDVNAISILLDSTFANRPDIVAYEYYGTSKLEWVILQYNNIVDVREEFTVGKTIVIPSPDYVYSYILTKAG